MGDNSPVGCRRPKQSLLSNLMHHETCLVDRSLLGMQIHHADSSDSSAPLMLEAYWHNLMLGEPLAQGC